MIGKTITSCAIVALGVLALASAPRAARATEPPAPCSESLANLAGTWSLVSVQNFANGGQSSEPYGPNPAGRLMIDLQGRYSIQIFRPDRPPFVAKDKNEGTPSEYAAAVRGSNAHFGRIVIDAARCQLVFSIERATFPNWEGSGQRRDYRLDHERLVYTVPEATQGRATTGSVVWRRLP